MTFVEGQKYRLKASKRVFKVLSLPVWGIDEIKFDGDREKYQLNRATVEAESEDIPSAG